MFTEANTVERLILETVSGVQVVREDGHSFDGLRAEGFLIVNVMKAAKDL